MNKTSTLCFFIFACISYYIFIYLFFGEFIWNPWPLINKAPLPTRLGTSLLQKDQCKKKKAVNLNLNLFGSVLQWRPELEIYSGGFWSFPVWLWGIFMSKIWATNVFFYLEELFTYRPKLKGLWWFISVHKSIFICCLFCASWMLNRFWWDLLSIANCLFYFFLQQQVALFSFRLSVSSQICLTAGSILFLLLFFLGSENDGGNKNAELADYNQWDKISLSFQFHIDSYLSSN